MSQSQTWTPVDTDDAVSRLMAFHETEVSGPDWGLG
jgi:hypothetical protein